MCICRRYVRDFAVQEQCQQLVFQLPLRDIRQTLLFTRCVHTYSEVWMEKSHPHWHCSDGNKSRVVDVSLSRVVIQYTGLIFRHF